MNGSIWKYIRTFLIRLVLYFRLNLMKPAFYGDWISDHECRTDRGSAGGRVVDAPVKYLVDRSDQQMFHASNPGGDEQLFVFFERFGEGVAQAFIFLIHEGRTLTFHKATALDESRDMTHRIDGLEIVCVEPQRSWSILFDGTMREGDEETHVEFRADFTAVSPPFNWMKHLTVSCLEILYETRTLLQSLKNILGMPTTPQAFDQFAEVQLNIAVSDHVVDEPGLTRISMIGGRYRNIENDSLLMDCTTHLFGHSNDLVIHCVNAKRQLDLSKVSGCSLRRGTAATQPITGVLRTVDGMQMVLKTGGANFCVRSRSRGDLAVFRGPSNLSVETFEGEINGETCCLWKVYATRSRSMIVAPRRLKGFVREATLSTELASARDETAIQSELTGVLGSTQAVLMDPREADGKFRVPRSVVLTTDAFDSNVRAHRAAGCREDQPMQIRDVVENATTR